jgi:putative aldouronate transport system substrate-binding protein
MKVNFKKTIATAILFVFTMVITIMTPVVSTTAKAFAKADVPKIQISYPGNGDQKDVALVNAALSKYTREKIGCDVQIKVLDWGTWFGKLPAMIATNQPLDILFGANWCNYPLMVSNKAYKDLGPLFNKYAPNTKKLFDGPNKVLLDSSKVKGIQYMIPVVKEVGAGQSIVYRADLLKKYKIDATKIKSIKDLENAFEVIKKAGDTSVKWMWDNMNVAPSFGVVPAENLSSVAWIKNGTFKVIYQAQDPDWIAAAKTTHEWYQKGYINPDTKAIDDIYKTGDTFAAGNSYTPNKEAEVNATKAFDWKVVQISPPASKANQGAECGWTISRSCKNPEMAMKVLELMFTDEWFLNTINYGVEGTHYVKKDAKTVDMPSGVTSQNNGYFPNMTWSFGNQFLSWLPVDAPKDQWEQYIAFNKTAKPSMISGFVFDTKNVLNEIGACNNVFSKYDFVKGALDTDTAIDKMLKEYKANGGDKIIKECQTQVNAFIAKYHK